MRSIRWLIITGAVVIGVAVLAIAVGAIWLNSFIHSPGFKDEVESRASASIGGPVQVASIDFDVLHGIKLKGFVTQIDSNHTGGQGALKVNVAQVNCTYSLWDLLARKLRLTGVILDQPQITLTKQPTEPMQTSAQSSPGSGGTSTASGSSSGSLFQFVLDRVKINDGTVTLLDAGGANTATLQGINASADTAGYSDGKDVTGSLKVAKVTSSNMQVTDFSTPFTYHTNYLAAKDFSATAYSGDLKGDFLMDGSAGPSNLTLNGNGLNVEQLTAATTSASSAHLTGSLDFQSKWRGIETSASNGEGDAQMSGGKLQGVKILDDIASVLKINELKDPVISKAVTHFTVHDRQVDFNGLQVTSQVFSITGHGTTGFDGSLNADLVLILTSDAMSKLPKQLAQAFVQQSDGTGTIGFKVTGTTSNPSTDLPQKLLMQGAQKQIKNELNKALNKFFH
ncbi:MAG TPA: hypothetical protein VHY09_07180 [Candidatus Methylacidiphilales bacterium]|nr:hypothetical protein [Candidatus Methylacidiphilales bacterium]